MHIPSDRPSSSAPDDMTPAARPITRNFKSSTDGMSHPEVSKALGRFGATPAGKPPLPPTASKAVSAYWSAQKQKEVPATSKAASLKTRASSPGLPPDPPSTLSSSPTSSSAAPMSHQGLARPVTRRLKHQQQQLLLPDAVTDPELTTAEAEPGTASPPTARNFQRNAAASPLAGPAGSMSHQPETSCQGKAVGTHAGQASAAGKLPSASKKRRAEVPLCVLANEGECLAHSPVCCVV